MGGKYIADKWGAEELGHANANSFGPLVTKLGAPRTDTPEKVAPVELNEHQHALYLFSVHPESQMATVETAEDYPGAIFSGDGESLRCPRSRGGESYAIPYAPERGSCFADPVATRFCLLQRRT